MSEIILPVKSLNNLELDAAAVKLNLKNYRGTFCRNNLPKNIQKTECGILNLDDSYGPGTHWVCWFKDGDDKYYFDSYGLQPPTELISYLKPKIFYTTECIQPQNTVICGHLCLHILKNLSRGEPMQLILNKLY